jgi:outer membrane protein assembly factor BamB
MACQSAFSSSDDGSWDGAVPNPAHPLEKGTAALPEEIEPGENDWPMLRHNRSRSGAVKATIPDGLTQKWHFNPERSDVWVKSLLRKDWWQTSFFKRKLASQPVIANGRAFVSQLEKKCVTALDLKSGKVLWTRRLPARADVSPSIAKGLALVGCSDGWVYALRADNGEMVYRLRIAPAERRIVSGGQLESSWPVVGGVLVVGDMGYATAGITTEVDGGLYVVAFDIKSGKFAWEGRRNLNNPGDIGPADHNRDKQEGAGAADVLNSDGQLICIGSRRGKNACFDAKTGKSGGTYHGGAYTLGMLHGPRIYCSANGLYCSVKEAVLKETKHPRRKKGPGSIYANKGKKKAWGLSTGFSNPVAIAAGGDRLAAAISKKDANELWIVSSADGKKLASFPLPSAPTSDGIAIAKDVVLVTLADGSVVCFGKK